MGFPNTAVKVSFAAIAAAWSLGSSAAITMTDTVADARAYAKEVVASGATLTDAFLTTVGTLGFGVSSGSTRYLRYDLSNAKWAGAVSVGNLSTGMTATGASGAIVQGGAAGDSYVIFQLTAGSDTAATVGTTMAIGTPGVKVTSTDSNVGITYTLHETATAAAAGTGTGLAQQSETVATFSNALKVVANAGSNVSSVEQSFKKWTTGSATTLIAKLATLNNVPATAYNAGGTTVSQADLVSTAKYTVAGNFSAAAGNSSIFVSTTSDCSSTAFSSSLNTAKTSADIVIGTSATTYSLCYTVNGTVEIPEGSYTAVYDVTAAASSTAADVTIGSVSTVTHDGTTLYVPLAQVPNGWSTRLVMNNTGASDGIYTVTAIGEDGATVTLTGAGASGTLKAGKTTVVDLANATGTKLFTVTGNDSAGNPLSARTGLKIIIARPTSEIQGLYQIVSPSGTVSNHLLAR